MKVYLLFIALFLTSQLTVAQESPHGPLKIECQICHSTDSWSFKQDGSFDHASTGFALLGQHRATSCATCHTDLKFSGTSPTCKTCHADIHKSELGDNCLRCHTFQSWKISDMVQKHQQTRFTLLGKHTLLSCESCHHNAANYQYKGTPVECISCHRTDFLATANPNHSAAGFSTDCSLCHKINALQWDRSFDHNLTGFLLTGAHRAAPCSDCHGDNVFKGKPTQCVSCHQSDFTTALNPDHARGGFSTDCMKCHTTTAWQPATFQHSMTNFPLTGKHLIAQCQDCHTNNNYQLTYTSCYQCHKPDFDGTTNPNHVTLNFSHDCQTCHSTTDWSGATFNHATTNFALTGKHATTQCQSCHVNNNYQLTYSNCYQCHQTDFAGTTNPNHPAANFSQDCQTCHSTTAWTPSTFNHDQQYFKIYSGRHQQQWTLCTQCHSNINNYAEFTCISCHTHNQTSMDSAHQGRTGYSYSSPACYNCHRGV